MGLVDDDRVVAAQLAVALHLAEQDAVGHHLDPGGVAAVVAEAHLVADEAAELDLHLLGDPLGDRAGGDPPGLGVPDLRTSAATAELEAHLGHLGRLARAGLPRDDDDLVVADRSEDVVTAGRRPGSCSGYRSSAGSRASAGRAGMADRIGRAHHASGPAPDAGRSGARRVTGRAGTGRVSSGTTRGAACEAASSPTPAAYIRRVSPATRAHEPQLGRRGHHPAAEPGPGRPGRASQHRPARRRGRTPDERARCPPLRRDTEAGPRGAHPVAGGLRRRRRAAAPAASSRSPRRCRRPAPPRRPSRRSGRVLPPAPRSEDPAPTATSRQLPSS